MIKLTTREGETVWIRGEAIVMIKARPGRTVSDFTRLSLVDGSVVDVDATPDDIHMLLGELSQAKAQPDADIDGSHSRGRARPGGNVNTFTVRIGQPMTLHECLHALQSEAARLWDDPGAHVRLEASPKTTDAELALIVFAGDAFYPFTLDADDTDDWRGVLAYCLRRLHQEVRDKS